MLVTCLYCNKKFEKPTHAIKRRPNHFCSCFCANTFRRENNVKRSLGIRYGFLTVLADAGVDKNHNSQVICECICGNKKIVVLNCIKSGCISSCGCGGFKNFADRFWSFVDRQDDDHWIWTGCKDQNGYGHITRNGKVYFAHRMAWELINGVIPDGLCVLHRFDDPSNVCVKNLFLGTKGDNNRDKAQKGRAPVFKGEKNPMSKLSLSNVHAIRKMLETGHKLQRDIAILFGVSRTTISDIKRQRTWYSA